MLARQTQAQGSARWGGKEPLVPACLCHSLMWNPLQNHCITGCQDSHFAKLILVGDNKDLFMFSLVPAVPRCTFEWGINDGMYPHHNARVFSELYNRD